MSTITIPLISNQAVKFGDSCIVCSKAKAKERKLTLSRNIATGQKSNTLQFTLDAPYCERCFAHDSKIFYVTLLPFILFGLIAAAALFIITLPYAPDVSSSTNAALGLALPYAAALIGGIFVGTLAEIGSRVICMPFLGRTLLQLPLFLVELITDKSGIYGLVACITKDGKEIKLDFSNPATAQRIKQFNGGDLVF